MGGGGKASVWVWAVGVNYTTTSALTAHSGCEPAGAARAEHPPRRPPSAPARRGVSGASGDTQLQNCTPSRTHTHVHTQHLPAPTFASRFRAAAPAAAEAARRRAAATRAAALRLRVVATAACVRSEHVSGGDGGRTGGAEGHGVKGS